jgi:hypothetical protein
MISNSKNIDNKKIYYKKITLPAYLVYGGKIITSLVGYLLFRYLGLVVLNISSPVIKDMVGFML